MSEKMGGKFTGSVPTFYMYRCNGGCSLGSYDYEKEVFLEVVEGVTMVGPRWSYGALWDLSVLPWDLPSMTF